jgi:hypothetical protein
MNSLLDYGYPGDVSYWGERITWSFARLDFFQSEVPTFSLPAPENCGEFIINATGSAVIASAVWKIMEHHHLVGGFKHEFYFPFHILYGMSSFPLTNSYFS